MIVLAIMALAGAMFSALVAILPEMPDPDETLVPAAQQWDLLASYMSGAAGWFPFGFAAVSLLIVGAGALAAGTIKLARVGLSLFTGGGGGAG